MHPRFIFALSFASHILPGFQDKQGNSGSSNARSLSVSGTIYMESGDFISVFVYSDKDPSYRVQSESGWGCHMLRTRLGFHAHLNKDLKFGRGWNNVAGWLTSNRGKGDEELYALGGGISGDGNYQVRKTGYYVCTVEVCACIDVACCRLFRTQCHVYIHPQQLRIDAASKDSYFRATVSLNGNFNVNGGGEVLHTV